MKEPTLKTIQHAGEYGNAARAVGKVTFEGDAIATAGRAFVLPPDVTVVDAYFYNAALGASSTIKLDLVGESGTTALIAAANTATAGRQAYAGKPVKLSEKTTATLTVGGAAATGDVDLVIEYVYNGS